MHNITYIPIDVEGNQLLSKVDTVLDSVCEDATPPPPSEALSNIFGEGVREGCSEMEKWKCVI